VILRPVALIAALALAACSPEAAKPNASAAASAPAATYGTVHGASGLKEVVAEFKTAMEAMDFRAMTSLSMPPALLEQIKKQNNIPPTTNASVLRRQIEAGLKQAADEVKFLEFSIDDSKSEFLTTPTGRKYALTPSSVIMEVQGTKMRSSNNYLALEDGGRWFLVNPSNASSIASIKAAYPDLADVALTEPNVEVVSQ
jgi:hypothetical protein